MVLLVLLGCFAVCLALAVGILRWSAGQNTVLQHGSPEYEIEVPQGYEDLRVEHPSQSSGTDQPASPAPAAAPSESQPAPSPAQSTTSPACPPARERMVPGQPPVLIFVIDDAGYRLDQLEKFLKLPFPLTIAVLPRVTYSAESAVRITNAGKELILHQPMQALGGKNPGEGAVLLSMDDETIRATVDINLASLGYPRGMNNHMGSAVTLDRRAMTAVLQLAKQYGMYYLDSLTAPHTVTADLSAALGVPCMERDVFLDNQGDRESILSAIEEGKRLARSRGVSVMIGHIWTNELAATLMEVYPQLVEEGYSLATISQFMQMQAGEHSDHAGSGN